MPPPRRRFPFRRVRREVPAGEEVTTVRRDVPPGTPPPEEPPGERELWPWLLALLVLVLAGLAAAYFLSQDDEPDRKNVPSVVGLREQAAVDRLAGDGFSVRVRREFANAKAGNVARQNPSAGTDLEEGGTVTIVVSRGPATVRVPNLRGLSEAEASAALTEVGLEANVVRVESTEPDGTVVAQNPEANEEVQRGSTVRINVSRGVTRTTTTTATTTTGTTPTTTGTTPTTTQPPETVTVPDVVGLLLPQAVSELDAVDLMADSYPVESEEPGGTVVAQTPVAGRAAPEGAAVRLNVSIGTGTRPQRTVPDVTGVDQETARARLHGTSLTVRAIYRTVTQQRQNGVVLLQRPSAGARLPVRTQVVIYVGRLG